MSKKLKKNIGIISVLILASFMIFRLIHNVDDAQWRSVKSQTVAGLFEYAYYNQNSVHSGTVKEMLIDSLKHSGFVISTIDVVDSVNKKVITGFYNDTLKQHPYQIKEQNIFIILINRYDSLIAEGVPIDSKDTLKKQIIEYILNPLNRADLPEKRIQYINEIGNVQVSMQSFYLRAQMIPDCLELSTSWEDLFQTLGLLLDSYQELRDAVSVSIFNRNFSDLELDKQIAVSKIFPVRIKLFLNYHFKPPPPPPPPLSTYYFFEE